MGGRRVADQNAYIRDALLTAEHQGLDVLEVDEAIQRRFNADVDAALKGTVWNDAGCRSPFLDETDRNGFNHP